MAGPRSFVEESKAIPEGTITLVEGTTFAICGQGGDIEPVDPFGLFVADMRICSQLEVLVNGARIEPLSTASPSPFETRFIGRSPDGTFLVERHMRIGRGMRLDLSVTNVSHHGVPLDVQVRLGADFADMFAVKEGRNFAEPGAFHATGSGVQIESAELGRGVEVSACGGFGVGDGPTLYWHDRLEERQRWETCLSLAAVRDGEVLAGRFRCGEPPERTVPSMRRAAWLDNAPRVSATLPGLSEALERSVEDLGALRLYDPRWPDEPLVAAGAPWFMTLFGRDSLITAIMALPLDPALGLGTARALARLQGKDFDPSRDEQPGRIPHEVRNIAGRSLELAAEEINYGTSDATPLFVMLVHELWRWGVPMSDLGPLLPSVDAALEWLAGPGDSDGDGYVDYVPSGPSSLRNQGWKDSFDGVNYANGTLAVPPLALAEVQAYAYGAWKGGADLARATGRESTAVEREHRARDLQRRFQSDFWLEERAAFAIARDGEGNLVDAVASNMGHCLWTGIVEDFDKAEATTAWLTSVELFNGWGIRTLATSMGAYNPISYHNGSVWPHDTALAVAGLRRSGFDAEALRVAGGLIDAAAAVGGRLPELFAGVSRSEFPRPVPYPASCSPQAWAAAAPWLVLRALLGLEPNVPAGYVVLDPLEDGSLSRIRVEGLAVAGTRVEIDVADGDVNVIGLPPGVDVRRGRPGRLRAVG